MTIKSSGSLSMSEINAELGRSNTATNLGNSALRTLAGKATGAIKFSDFYGKTHEIVVTLAASNSIVLVDSFSSSDWESSVPKRVIIPAGVEIGATTSYAIATSLTAAGQAGNFGGTLTLENRGTISGMGGAANSGVGGNALLTSFLGRDGNKLIIQNYGTIRAGGGGGGRGGDGGNGQTVITEGPTYINNPFGSSTMYQNATGAVNTTTIYWNWNLLANTGTFRATGLPVNTTTHTEGGWTYTRVGASKGSYTSNGTTSTYYEVTRTQSTPTTGGSGGNGARGQGFDGAAGTGANGAAGGTNAGTGGKGGDGGGWGTSGATGSTGTNGNVSNGAAGAAGGLAGFYITAGANVTLVNSGTVQGRLG